MVTQTANYISHIVVDGSAIGIVTFHNGASNRANDSLIFFNILIIPHNSIFSVSIFL